MEDSSDQTLYDYVKYKMTHSDFVHGFIASLSMIIVSELGDKTFFIAAIMSMRHSRLVVLAGALGALVAMTILSGEFSSSSKELLIVSPQSVKHGLFCLNLDTFIVANRVSFKNQ